MDIAKQSCNYLVAMLGYESDFFKKSMKFKEIK